MVSLNESLEQIRKIINSCETIALLAHENPDGDAIGATLALALGLKGMNKKPVVLLEQYSSKFDVIPGKELLYKGSLENLQVDAVIVLDCSTKNRVGYGRELLDSNKKTAVIDHHVNGEAFASINCVDEKAPSTCSIVFELLISIVPITKEIASALYAGIVYDTGGFRHSSTSAETHVVASRLVGLGIPFTDIYNSILLARSLKGAKLLSLAISRLEVKDGVGCTYVTMGDYEKIGATYKDGDEIVNYLNCIDEVKVAVFAYEKAEGKTKVSLRARNVNVQQIASKFGGGGHELAAGCDVLKGAVEAMNEVVSVVLK